MPTRVPIRRLQPNDAPAYRALRLRGLREHPLAFISSAQEEEHEPLEKSQARLAGADAMFWGAFEENALRGAVGLERERRAKNRHKAVVVGMYVAAEATGCGIGRGLLHALLQGAASARIELLVLTVTEGEGSALRLYESIGFRPFGTEPRALRWNGRDHAKIHMFLELPTS